MEGITQDPSVPLPIEELVARCLRGNQSAMAALVARYQGRVFGLCFRMLQQRQDAEDMAQETFVRALKSLDQWDPARPFEPWLLTIAGNRCRTLLGRRGRRVPTQTLSEPVLDESPDLQAARQLAEEVDLALVGIRDEYRQAFLLFHKEEMSYIEIAAALECPLGTAKTWVRRARQELIDRLSQRQVFQEPINAVR